MAFPNLAVIGAGNMGHALLKGLIAHGHPPYSLWASGINAHKLEALHQELGIHVSTDNRQAVETADVILLAVKPQKMHGVASEIASIVKEKQPLILSIAAGVRIKTLAHWLAGHARIIRAMPNIPASIGCGATGLFAESSVSPSDRTHAERIMDAVGSTIWVPEEKLLDVVTALSGAGPAYFFLIMEALEKAAAELGLSPAAAHILTLQTALGAAKMAQVSEATLATLRERVTSPQGATLQGLNVLNAHDIQVILHRTLLAARERAEALAQESERL